MRPSYDVLKKLKSNLKYQDRISRDIDIDANASKRLCESLCLHSPPGKLVGYVQEINSNPFGLLLMSHIQVFENKEVILNRIFSFKGLMLEINS